MEYRGTICAGTICARERNHIVESVNFFETTLRIEWFPRKVPLTTFTRKHLLIECHIEILNSQLL